MAHGLDDVVQWFMFPVGDPGTGGVQRHAKWFGPEYTGHLRVGTTPVGNRRWIGMRAGGGLGLHLRRIAQDRLVPGAVLALGRASACHGRRPASQSAKRTVPSRGSLPGVRERSFSCAPK